MNDRKQNMLSQRLSNRRLIVDLLALMFGLGAWVGVNGIYVQLPLLVNNAPEGWSLPAHMVMLVQFANLGPILYTLYIKYSKWACDKYITYVLLAAAALSTFILAFVYDKSTVIFGNEHSTALLSLMFVTAIVGCTSSVLFMPYMRNYREIYLVSYLVGEGLSGFVPSTVALIQGVGGNPECLNTTKPNSTMVEFTPYYPEPRFSCQTFFIFIGTLLFLCYLSFLGLNNLSVAVGERVKHPDSMETLPTDTRAPPSYKTNAGWTMSKQVYSYLLIMMAVVCFLSNGTLPSIQSYSCLPYGNIAYHLTVTLSSMAGPLAMCLGFVIKTPKVSLLSGLMVVLLALSGFICFLAVKSPTPPLQHSWMGEFLVVLAWILISGLVGFIKLGITTLFRPDPGRGLYYTGVATQIGSLEYTKLWGFINGTMRDVTKASEKRNNGTYIGVHLLVILFGISAWIGINGIFIQIPVLINTSPEGWALPAYLVLVIQASNVGPLLYTILQYFRYKINEPWWILCLLVSGTSAMGLLSFFYSERTFIAGDQYSLVLFILTFFNALVGCFSSVLFMPYLCHFNEKFLVSYFIGEGLSGALPSIIALIQGIGDTSKCTVLKNATDVESDSNSYGLNFSPSEYFLFIFVILFLSLTAFTILEYTTIVQKAEHVHGSVSAVVVGERKEANVSHDYVNDVEKKTNYSLEGNSFPNDDSSKHLTKGMQNYLFTLLAICCFLSNGFFPSIQSYSCLPYGNIAYQLSITFAQFVNPLACLLAFWLTLRNIKVISYLFLVSLALGSYVTYIALMSPFPPLLATKLGIFLVVASWTLLVGSISYLKLIIVSVFKRNTMLPNILFNTGVIMQIGSASGAIFSFITINFTNYVKMHDNCT